MTGGRQLVLLLQLAAMICVHDEVSTTYTTLSGGQVVIQERNEYE